MTSTVYVIDDDKDIMNFVNVILQSLNLTVECYDSVENFLNNVNADQPGCILSDVVMPGTDGLELQQILISRKIHLPLILMSSYGDIEMARKGFKSGAVDFIQKPLSASDLVHVINQALKQAQSNQTSPQQDSLKDGLAHLTKREKQVYDLLTSGKNNKEIARECDISVRTVETHRLRILKKLDSPTLQKLLAKINQ